MKTLLRFIVLLATTAVVITLLFGGVFLETGNLDVLETRSLLPEVGSLEIIPISDAIAQETGAETVLRFTWRGEKIIYDHDAIDETEFAAMLKRAKTNGAEVEVLKYASVRGLDANRWRQLLDDAEVQYEILPQDR